MVPALKVRRVPIAMMACQTGDLMSLSPRISGITKGINMELGSAWSLKAGRDIRAIREEGVLVAKE